MNRNDRQYLRKKGPERVILFGSKSFHVYVCFGNGRFCDAMFLVKKKKCAGHTYYSAVSPPSEFYNIQIDGSRVKCLVCGIIVGQLDSKIDSIVLDIEKIRLVRIEPRNLTAVCTSKDSDHMHEMLVSSAYCDTVYKSYNKPEFYSVSRYQTLKQPCHLLPDKLLGFNFIGSISRSFRYIRVHRFRHPSSLRGIYNPLSFTSSQTTTSDEIETMTILSDSSNISIETNNSESQMTLESSRKLTSVFNDIKMSTENCTSTTNSLDQNASVSINNQKANGFSPRNEFIGGRHAQQSYLNSCYDSLRNTSTGYGDLKNLSHASQLINTNPCSPCSDNLPTDSIPHPVLSFSAFNFSPGPQYTSKISDFILNSSVNDRTSANNISMTQRIFNGYEIPNDFDMVHFN